MPSDYQRYILKDRQPVICDDESTWREFIRNSENVLVAQDQVGRFEVLTLFLGFNSGTPDKPIFFQTTIIGADDNHPKHAATWEQAERNHAGNIKVITLTANHEAAVADGTAKEPFKPVEWLVFPGELHFVLESEQAAIKALPENSEFWERRGKTLIFLVKSTDS